MFLVGYRISQQAGRCREQDGKFCANYFIMINIVQILMVNDCNDINHHHHIPE